MKPQMKLVGRNTSKQTQGFSREDATWFLSLPDKVQRQCFTKEEHAILTAACEAALVDLKDETYWSYGSLSSVGRPNQPASRETRTKADGARDEELPDCSNVSLASSLHLPIHKLREPELPRSRGSMSSRRHSRNSSSASRNFSFPFHSQQGTDQEDQRVTTWLAETARYTIKSPAPENKAQFYQDPETRKKLRRYVTTPQGFDEALELGFLADDVSVSAGADHARSSSHSSSAVPSLDETTTRDERDALPTLSRTDPGSPNSLDPSEFSIKTPVSASPTRPRLTERSSSSRWSERDMTFRMTLTRPELRSSEKEMYGWQQKDQAYEGPLDPWALDPLPVSDDFTGNSCAFMAVEKDGKIFRKFWNKLGRR